MIDTKEKRRAVIDFGKIRGMGMPIPSGTINEASRGHILNLYPGILPPQESFFFWRNRGIQGSTWLNRVLQTSTWKGPGDQESTWVNAEKQSTTWKNGTDADDAGWTPGKEISDS